MNPFDLPGPEFLVLLFVVAALALAGGIFLRRSFRGPSKPLPEEPRLMPPEVAYLAGGPALAVHAALARLVDDGTLAFDHSTQLLHKRDDEPGKSELERAVLRDAGQTFSVKEAFAAAGPALEVIRNRLDELGLVLSQGRARAANWVIPMALFLVLLFGVAKIGVGVSRDRPVGFLIAACVVLAGVAWFATRYRAVLTLRGEDLLSSLRGRHAALQAAVRKAPATLHGHDLALAVGLFGAGVLAAGAYAGLHQAMLPAVREQWIGSSGGDWSSCSSGWSSCASGSSGSCASGSSCGGGDGGGSGCGGGGCGGCGGGGGD